MLPADNPVTEFLKLAEKRTQVRSHVRRQGNKLVVVEAHDREVDEADDKPLISDKPDTDKELELWRAWKEGGQKPEDLEPLLKSFRPLLQHKMGPYLGRVKMVPDSVIETEFKMQFVRALQTYDPDKGVKLGTYVYMYLDKAKRFIVENQNIGRIPENRAYKIKQFTVARDMLNEQLDRPPTQAELAKELGWKEAEVERMDSELRSDLVTQGFEEDPYTFTPSKSEEILKLFKYELAGQEREVYEYLTGFGKPKESSTGAIAKKLGIPDYKVSRLRDSIQKKLRHYMEGLQ